MTVAEIIAAARQYTQIAGSSWFSGTDELRSVNRAYRDIYEKIVDANDEYYIIEVDVLPASLVEVRPHIFEYTLPAGWYRLRSLRGILDIGEVGLDRLDPKDFYQREGYRYFNQKIRLFYTNPYNSFRIEYYPVPTEYTLTTENINYPPQIEPLIIAYSIAIDIVESQKGDASKLEIQYAKLWDRFSKAIAKRDNFNYPKVANYYRSTMPGW